MKREITDETRMTERVSWFDRLLSRATLLLVFGVILFVFAVPTLISIGVAGFGWASWDSLNTGWDADPARHSHRALPGS